MGKEMPVCGDGCRVAWNVRCHVYWGVLLLSHSRGKFHLVLSEFDNVK
jgi:hypothetical protein